MAIEREAPDPTAQKLPLHPQHADRMSWSDAPPWATHIVGWAGNREACYWAEHVGGNFYCERTRGTNVSFWMLGDDEDEDDNGRFGWVVVAERPFQCGIDGSDRLLPDPAGLRSSGSGANVRIVLPWQPMTTAPRDGTAVLILLAGSDIPHAARWLRGADDLHATDTTAGPGWYLTWDGWLVPEHDGPRYWMHISHDPDDWEMEPMNNGET